MVHRSLCLTVRVPEWLEVGVPALLAVTHVVVRTAVDGVVSDTLNMMLVLGVVACR